MNFDDAARAPPVSTRTLGGVAAGGAAAGGVAFVPVAKKYALRSYIFEIADSSAFRSTAQCSSRAARINSSPRPKRERRSNDSSNDECRNTYARLERVTTDITRRGTHRLKKTLITLSLSTVSWFSPHYTASHAAVPDLQLCSIVPTLSSVFPKTALVCRPFSEKRRERREEREETRCASLPLSLALACAPAATTCLLTSSLSLSLSLSVCVCCQSSAPMSST